MIKQLAFALSVSTICANIHPTYALPRSDMLESEERRSLRAVSRIPKAERITDRRKNRIAKNLARVETREAQRLQILKAKQGKIEHSIAKYSENRILSKNNKQLGSSLRARTQTTTTVARAEVRAAYKQRRVAAKNEMFASRVERSIKKRGLSIPVTVEPLAPEAVSTNIILSPILNQDFVVNTPSTIAVPSPTAEIIQSLETPFLDNQPVLLSEIISPVREEEVSPEVSSNEILPGIQHNIDVEDVVKTINLESPIDLQEQRVTNDEISAEENLLDSLILALAELKGVQKIDNSDAREEENASLILEQAFSVESDMQRDGLGIEKEEGERERLVQSILSERDFIHSSIEEINQTSEFFEDEINQHPEFDRLPHFVQLESMHQLERVVDEEMRAKDFDYEAYLDREVVSDELIVAIQALEAQREMIVALDEIRAENLLQEIREEEFVALENFERGVQLEPVEFLNEVILQNPLHEVREEELVVLENLERGAQLEPVEFPNEVILQNPIHEIQEEEFVVFENFDPGVQLEPVELHNDIVLQNPIQAVQEEFVVLEDLGRNVQLENIAPLNEVIDENLNHKAQLDKMENIETVMFDDLTPYDNDTDGHMSSEGYTSSDDYTSSDVTSSDETSSETSSDETSSETSSDETSSETSSDETSSETSSDTTSSDETSSDYTSLDEDLHNAFFFNEGFQMNQIYDVQPELDVVLEAVEAQQLAKLDLGLFDSLMSSMDSVVEFLKNSFQKIKDESYAEGYYPFPNYFGKRYQIALEDQKDVVDNLLTISEDLRDTFNSLELRLAISEDFDLENLMIAEERINKSQEEFVGVASLLNIVKNTIDTLPLTPTPVLLTEPENNSGGIINVLENNSSFTKESEYISNFDKYSGNNSNSIEVPEHPFNILRLSGNNSYFQESGNNSNLPFESNLGFSPMEISPMGTPLVERHSPRISGESVAQGLQKKSLKICGKEFYNQNGDSSAAIEVKDNMAVKPTTSGTYSIKVSGKEISYPLQDSVEEEKKEESGILINSYVKKRKITPESKNTTI